MDKKLIWVWLSLLFGEGNLIYKKLIEHFQGEQAIYDADDEEIDSIEWLEPHEKKLLKIKTLKNAEDVLEWCCDKEVNVLAYSDDEYPNSLRELDDFPAVLYYLGEFPDFDNELSISIVGTRYMSDYGQRIAFDMGYCLSKAGAITVSGFACGIDASVAQGTLNAFGRTVGFLACGIDVNYPYKTKTIRDNVILYGGAVITEFPPNTPANEHAFKVRNRLISGISNGTVIVEAPEISGAKITARHALRQEKKLFAVPGPAKMGKSDTPNELIKEGKAILVRNALDILQEYLEQFGEAIDLKKAKHRPRFSMAHFKERNEMLEKKKEHQRKAAKSMKNVEEKFEDDSDDTSILSDEGRKIYTSMEDGKLYSADDLVLLTGLSASAVMANMSMLEMAGKITIIDGSNCMKI
jgi:DNA processing protein